MKKLFSLLAVAAMAFTACQNDEGVKNPTLADEGIVNLSVGVPELATRALDGDNQSGADSAYGAIDYANYTSFLESEYDVRFQLAVYEAGAAEDAEPIYTDVKYVDFASTTNFNDLRFVPGREYQFVIFADFVKQGTEEDFRYNTADLRNITAFEALNAMDETYDAYFFNSTLKVEAGKVNELEAVLKRPFGKVRVLTTDIAWVEEYAVPAAADVTFYNHAIYKSFNALTGEVAVEAANAEETISYDINRDYYGATEYEGKEAFTLFATYVLATNAQEALNFRLDSFEADGSLIKSIDFNTEIPYQRNHLTTLVGNLLTNEADVFVRIDDNFDAEEFVKGDFENLETGLGYVREGVHVAGQVYEYETNLFSFQLLSETDGTDLREGTYEYTEEVAYLQNATGFRVNGIDVEKGTLTVTERGTRAGNFYDVVFDIYATINGKTENYILTWNGQLKAARTQLAEPVVSYEVDEVDYLYITFSWEAVEGAKNYTVEWNGEKQTVEGTSATFDFSGENTYATAYVTANPEFTWSYEAATGSVTVDWKKPIVYTEVEVFLQYIKGDEIAFYNDNYTVYFEKYPSLEGAWYQVKGQLPVPFSTEAEVVETVGSDAKVAIFEPTTATCFLYKGALGTPYVLTEAEVKWTDGANTVAVAFSNEAGDAITMHTAVPLAEGRFDITPSYVAIAGDEAVNIEKTQMNVLLDNNVYTVFFNVHSAINDILMVYVGEIDFEKPYAPDYVLESYTAGPETINFVGEDAEFEILATSLESGEVIVKKLILTNSDDYAAAGQVTAATAVVTEENGVYDARYTVTVNLPIVGEKTSYLQYVGTFKAYEAPVEPAKPIEFEATYEVKAGAYFFTGVNYDFSIIVNNLATTEYITGETEDAWAFDWSLGQPMNNFRTGDFLTVENNVVTIEFTANLYGEDLRYKMTCDMNETPGEPEDIYLSATVNGTVYTAVEDDDYMIDYYQGEANAYYKKSLLFVTVDVADRADDIEFTFFHEARNANVHIIYHKNAVTPATDVEVYLTLENGLYYGLYETTTYAISVEDGIAQAQYADGNKGVYKYEMSENTTFLVFKFVDTVNNVNVTALYQKTNTPAEPVYDNLTTLNNNEFYSSTKYGYQWYFKSEAGFYGDFYVANGKNTSELVEGEYAWNANYADGAGTPGFTVSMRDANKAIVEVTSASLKVEGKVVYLTVNENYFKGEIAAVEPEQPGTDEPVDEWTNRTEVAQKTTINGRVAYATENYTLASGYWYYAGGYEEGGQYTTEQTATGYIFTFDDEKNKLHVTITYSEFTVNDPWAFSAEVTGQNGFFVQVTLTGDNGDVIVVENLAQGSPMAPGTVIINGTETAVKGTVQIDNSTKVVVDLTSETASYKGTSKNTLF